MNMNECVAAARSCNHQAIQFRKKGKPSVANYFKRQRVGFMRSARELQK